MTGATRRNDVTASFQLAITNQHWLGERHEQAHDGCSHGQVRAVIGGTVVSGDDAEYGIAQSALALLRTLEQDHSPAEPVNGGYLLCHGCGYRSTSGARTSEPTGSFAHEGDKVVLSEPRHFDASTGETAFDVGEHVALEHYRREVVAFAETACDYYFSAEPRQLEQWERKFHEQFWAEFDERLKRAKSTATGGDQQHRPE